MHSRSGKRLLPKRMRSVINKALDADPAKRYQNAAQMADALRKVKLIDWRHTSVTGWGGTIAFALIFGKFVFGTWLFVLLPLYLFVPLRSVLWRWPVCTACGAVCGALILFFYWRLLRLPVTAHEIRDEMPSLIVAAFDHRGPRCRCQRRQWLVAG